MVSSYGIPRWIIAAIIIGGSTMMMLALSTITLAQEQPGDQFHRLTALPAIVQLTDDTTPVPASQAGIFVSSLGDGADEPEALNRGELQVAIGRTGRRLALAQRSYTVRIGRGPASHVADLDASTPANLSGDAVNGRQASRDMTSARVQETRVILQRIERLLSVRSESTLSEKQRFDVRTSLGYVRFALKASECAGINEDYHRADRWAAVALAAATRLNSMLRQAVHLRG